MSRILMGDAGDASITNITVKPSRQKRERIFKRVWGLGEVDVELQDFVWKSPRVGLALGLDGMSYFFDGENLSYRPLIFMVESKLCLAGVGDRQTREFVLGWLTEEGFVAEMGKVGDKVSRGFKGVGLVMGMLRPWDFVFHKYSFQGRTHLWALTGIERVED